MQRDNRLMGRVIRVGPGWADIVVGRTVQRITIRADRLIRVGNQIRLDAEGAIMPSPKPASSGRAR